MDNWLTDPLIPFEEPYGMYLTILHWSEEKEVKSINPSAIVYRWSKFHHMLRVAHVCRRLVSAGIPRSGQGVREAR